MQLEQIMENLTSTGITKDDALVIADCIVNRKSCSWVNTDPVDEKMINSLKEVILKNNYGIAVIIESIATRGKFIWEVKIK